MVPGRASGQFHQAATVGVAETDGVRMLRRSEDRSAAGGGGREKEESRATDRQVPDGGNCREGWHGQSGEIKKQETGEKEESQFQAC